MILACECDKSGSLRKGCDKDGKCSCKYNYQNQKCTECATGYEGDKCKTCSTGYHLVNGQCVGKLPYPFLKIHNVFCQ